MVRRAASMCENSRTFVISVVLLLSALQNFACAAVNEVSTFYNSTADWDSTTGWSSYSETVTDPSPGTSSAVPGDIGDDWHVADSHVEQLTKRFREHISTLKGVSDRLDIVFLIDGSSSIGPNNFQSEIRFVKKLLVDFDVSNNGTRVAVVTFSSRSKVIRHVDQISNPRPTNDKCLLLNYQLPAIAYSGGGTYTYGALLEAEAIFGPAGAAPAMRAIFLITDGYSNGPSPIPVAKRLRDAGVMMFSLGIETGNDEELANLVTSDEHRYLLASFDQFEMLVRQALHLDYRAGFSVPVDNGTLCNQLCNVAAPKHRGKDGCCDERAVCSCSPSSGQYRCMCGPGYFGTGLHGECHPCPIGTFWSPAGFCEPCRSVRHITLQTGSTSAQDCVCPHGYQENEDGRCVAITCPKLQAPEHGYFVMDPKPCGQVLNAACGTRCHPGFQLTGSSIRLCQENGQWSGTEVKCTMKKCPPLSIPYYGMAVCSNPDLDLYYDYSPRNKSFLQNYSMVSERLTEAMPVDTECSFKCGPGFYLKGSHNRFCLPLSKWDGLQTTCTQILCPALPKVAFGTYDPTDCAEGKSAFGTNCTLVCDFGFEMKGGPSTKQCGGRRTGTWSKTKTPRCVDIVPPYIECPSNYTVLMDDDLPYAVVRRLEQPYVFDNSGDNFTYWAKPALSESDYRLPLGEHEFAYIAVDSFKNKARCRFSVTVVDQTPPLLEGCVDAPVQYVSDASNPQELLVRWQEPVAFDNSDNVTVGANLTFGFLPVGVHLAHYRATDLSGNVAECTVKVEVRQLSCEVPARPPPHSVSLCAQNTSHVWCELSCVGDYAFHAGQSDAPMLLVCEHARPGWRPAYEGLECTELVQPLGVEKVMTIQLDGGRPLDPGLCSDEAGLREVSQVFAEGLRQAMCDAQENCTLLTTLSACPNVTATDGSGEEGDHYRIVRRSVRSAVETPATLKPPATVKVVMYKRISQGLGLWRHDGKQSENIKRIKEELNNINANKKLRHRLGTLNLDLSVLKLDERIRCSNGSIARKLVCVNCPAGTYHNYTTNSCQNCPVGTYADRPGQSSCWPCPAHHSTRRVGVKNAYECKPQCPPGTVAKLKVSKRPIKSPEAGGVYHKTLMPFCRPCEPGQYQHQYNQVQCLECPAGYTSACGSVNASDCYPAPGDIEPCDSGSANATLCGPYGRCVVAPTPQGTIRVSRPYVCLCDEQSVGEHCEKRLDPCLSAPCFNGGQCHAREVGGFGCHCLPSYAGALCEQYVDPCAANSCTNGANCVNVEGRALCECAPGFEGERCERRKDYCRPNPCEYGGDCVSAGEGYRCACPRGKMGRRCHLEPCDYMPCPAGALCRSYESSNGGGTQESERIFTMLRYNPPTTGQNDSATVLAAVSYQCVCPAGLRGANCSKLDNPCESLLADYCQNGATCEPVKLRSSSTVDFAQLDDYDDNDYRSVRCRCLHDAFFGKRCELHRSVDFVLEFPATGVHAYARFKLPSSPDSSVGYGAIGVCGWYQTEDAFNYGAIVSYATMRQDNALTLTDYSGLVLYVNGEHRVTNVTFNDGEWHLLCLSWTNAGGRYQLYLDGELRVSGRNLSADHPIPAGGLFVFGQEQDALGGGFSETESFRGRMTYVDVWSRALGEQEVRQMYGSCEPHRGGDLFHWADERLQTVGGLVRIEHSGFCGPCAHNLSLSNGAVRYEGTMAHFRCDTGYELLGPAEAICLRTARWSPGERVCKLIHCDPVGAPLNGEVNVSRTTYGGIARFRCDGGFTLAGPVDTIHCTASGNWSAAVPECVSLLKCAPLELADDAGLAHIVYATERGPIAHTLAAYDVGVLAEVHCAHGFTLEGESLITCDEAGGWDLPPPACVLPSERPMQQGGHSGTVIRITRRPDVRFWKHLRDYLLHGCGNRSVSVFCSFAAAGGNWSDLSGLSLQREGFGGQGQGHGQGQGSSIDVRLLAFLMRTIPTNAAVSSQGLLRPDNLMQYILYGDVASPIIVPLSRYSQPVEDAYRFLTCQFIDVILMDRELNYDGELEIDIALEENTNTKIKHLLKLVVQPIYRQYQQWEFEEEPGVSEPAPEEPRSVLPEPTTPACPAALLPTPPMDSWVAEIKLRALAATAEELNYERLRYSGLEAAVGDHVRYECEEGFHMRGSGTSECDAAGHWTQPDGFCEGALCEDPPVRQNMYIARKSLGRQYYINDEVEFRCTAGYAIKGHAIIKCQPNGRWTPILARCSRISCGRPNISPESQIVSGSSFVYGDALTVRCRHQLLNIFCQSNGQWSLKDEC